jgi:hypothetical protein
VRREVALFCGRTFRLSSPQPTCLDRQPADVGRPAPCLGAGIVGASYGNASSLRSGPRPCIWAGQRMAEASPDPRWGARSLSLAHNADRSVRRCDRLLMCMATACGNLCV